MSRALRNNNGFGLIELTIAIIIIGILAGIAMQSMTSVVGDIRRTKTEREMELLANAIVGDPNVTQGGGRVDFGYVGDVGSFPPNLNALYNNPGGYSTWDGPYLPPGFTQDSTGLKTDEWGSSYNYSGGITITSTGSGSTITKKIARAGNDYLLNAINGTVRDGADSIPGSIYRDSVDIKITIPDGSGGTQTKLYFPDSAGDFTLDSIPVGTHPLRIIYTPGSDTIFRYLTIYPRHKSGITNYKFAADYFGDTTTGGGGSPEILRPSGAGSQTTLSGSGCSSNWQCVDEATTDEDATYVVGSGGSWDPDTYATENSSVGAGTIDSVIIYIRCKDFRGRTAIVTYGKRHESNDINLTGSYTNYSETYTTNPETSSPWTWTEIDAIEIGVTLKEAGRCTQVWLEVHYTP